MDQDCQTRTLRSKLDCFKLNLNLVDGDAHRKPYETDVTTCSSRRMGQEQLRAVKDVPTG
jgi:hypothetical protein